MKHLAQPQQPFKPDNSPISPSPAILAAERMLWAAYCTAHAASPLSRPADDPLVQARLAAWRAVFLEPEESQIPARQSVQPWRAMW